MDLLESIMRTNLLPMLFATAAAAVGCGLLLFAGRQERLGRLESARGQARRGGMLLAAACLLHLVALIVWRTVQRPQADALWTGATSALFVLAGFVGLLAGLSGKPRPSGWFAVLFYVAAALSLWTVVAGG